MGNKIVSVKQRLRAYISATMAFVLALVLVASSWYPAAAVTNVANTLKVSPVRSDITAKPGETTKVPVIVTNLTDGDIMVHPSENDFVAGDESGTPSLILDETQYAPTHSLKRFMTPLSDVTIPAKQSKTIDVVIAVPASAQAGGYFGALRFAPTTPDGGGQVNLSASVASLILLTVPGALTEKLNLTSFDVQQNGKAGSLFHDNKNLAVAFRFENKGNVQVGPFGQIAVMKGKDIVYKADFNTSTPHDVVLPDSARKWSVPLEKIASFGHYTVTATLTYGSTNQTVQVSKSFWVIPFAYMVGAGIALLVLIGLIVGIWLFLRSYKRRILRSQSHRVGGYRRH